MIFRGANGFGDAFYVYPVLKHFLSIGKPVEILTKYPDVYFPLVKMGLIISDRYAKQPDIQCRYGPRYHIQETTTYQDTLILSGSPDNLPFKINFEFEKEFVFETKKKICVIRKPTMPMHGKPGGELLIPDCALIQKLIDAHKAEYYFVLAGNPEGDFEYPLKGIDFDLTKKLSIPQVIQLAKQADMVVTQCGFFIPICEVLDRRCFVIFSKKGMTVPGSFFQHITPKKVFNNYAVLNWAIDNEKFEQINEKFIELSVRELP